MAIMDSKVIESFVRTRAVIPFNELMGPEFDLLMAASVRSGAVGAQIVQMDAGFTSSYFSQLPEGADVGKSELSQLLAYAERSKHANFVGVYEKANSAGGSGSLLLKVVRSKAQADTTSMEETRYSVTDVTHHTLEGSPSLMPFLRSIYQLLL